MTSDPKPIPFLVFDADVLIKLGQHPGNMEAIAAIRTAVDSGKFRLVVPEAVQNAFNREKQKAADSYWNTQRAYVKNFRQLRHVLPISGEITTFADRLSAELNAYISDVPNTIEAIEALLSKGKMVSTTDAMKVEAANRVIQHKAPAVSARNSSVNDCIIWGIVKDAISAGGPLVFVTDNYTDFSDPKHNEKLHPDLVAELPASAKYCYHSLEGFRKHHLHKVTIVVPPPASAICTACHNSISPHAIPRPSHYGGWTYQLYCPNCQIYIDTGDPYDE